MPPRENREFEAWNDRAHPHFLALTRHIAWRSSYQRMRTFISFGSLGFGSFNIVSTYANVIEGSFS